MKKRKALFIALRFILGMILILLIWDFVLFFIYASTIWQDPLYDMGNNYYIVTWREYGDYIGGYLFHTDSNDNTISERIIYPEVLTEFALKEPWLIGKTERGWFAVNKRNNQLYYPCPSIEEIQQLIDIEIIPSDMETNPFPYIQRGELLEERTKKAKTYLWILLFTFPTFLALTPYIWTTKNKKA